MVFSGTTTIAGTVVTFPGGEVLSQAGADQSNAIGLSFSEVRFSDITDDQWFDATGTAWRMKVSASPGP